MQLRDSEPQIREREGSSRVLLRALVLTVLLLSTFYFLPTRSASAAKLFLNPSTATATIESTFITDVVVDTEGEVVNALSLELVYPATLLELREAQPTGRAFPLAPLAPRVEASWGRVMYEAGAPGGFQGQGDVLRLVWQVKGVGLAEVGFSGKTQILRHSSTPSPVFLDLIKGSFTLVRHDPTQVVVTSDDHPDEATWYSGPFVRMSWLIKPGASYSYVLSRSPNEQPDEVADMPVGDIKLATPEDGVFYFHLRECRGGSCGATITRRAMKDSTAPAPFQILVGQSDGAFEGKRFISFAATDAASGIDHYEVAEGTKSDTAWRGATSPYILKEQVAATKLWVRAYDRAGNLQEVYHAAPRAPGPLPRWVAALVGLTLVVVLCIAWFRRRTVAPNTNKT